MTTIASSPSSPPLAAAGKSHGIIFSAPMVRPILNTQPNIWPARAIDPNLPIKFQTRRAVKPQPDDGDEGDYFGADAINCDWYHPAKVDRFGEMYPGEERIFGFCTEDGEKGWKCPHPVGTELWVRETWKPEYFGAPGDIRIEFVADKSLVYRRSRFIPDEWVFPKSADKGNVSPLHLPRWASRIDLLVKSVRVERVQDISELDAIAEGFKDRAGFIELFSEHNPGAWEKNIWVFVYTFGRVK